jgi:tripartite-type tricarboxylate transporter receptor subunit TctC
MTLKSVAVLAAFACASSVGLDARAQDAGQFPSRAIHIVVGNAAGGGTDFLARLLGQKLSERLGQTVIIENKPGANSMLAAQTVIKAPADGHTLLMGSIGMLTVNPAVVANLSYDTQRDFVPISIFASFPLILTVNASLPIRSVADLIAYAANLTRPTRARWPIFQVVQKCLSAHRHQFPVRLSREPEAMLAMMRGDIAALCPTPPGRIPCRIHGALAVTTAKRLPSWPTPTMQEAGVKDMEVESGRTGGPRRHTRRRSSRSCKTRRWRSQVNMTWRQVVAQESIPWQQSDDIRASSRRTDATGGGVEGGEYQDRVTPLRVPPSPRACGDP